MTKVDLVRKVLGYAGKNSTERTANDYQPLFDLFADDITLRYTVPLGTPISGGFHGKQAVVDYFTTTVTEIGEEASTVGEPSVFGDDRRVVVVGQDSYTIKKNGVRCENKDFAMVVDFDGDLIHEIVLIKDLSELVAAYREETQGGS